MIKHDSGSCNCRRFTVTEISSSTAPSVDRISSLFRVPIRHQDTQYTLCLKKRANFGKLYSRQAGNNYESLDIFQRRLKTELFERSYNWYRACQTTLLLRDSLSLSRSFLLWPQPWSLSSIMLLWHSLLIIIIIRCIQAVSSSTCTQWQTRCTQTTGRQTESLDGCSHESVETVNSPSLSPLQTPPKLACYTTK